MGLGFLGMPVQNGLGKPQGQSGIFGMPVGAGGMGGGGPQSGFQKVGGGLNGLPSPTGPNYQLGQQGWQQGYGMGLPMSSGDHMPFVSTSQSHRPIQQTMAPGQNNMSQQQQPQAQGQGTGVSAVEPWNSPGWVQPTPTYNDPAWGSNAIGWGGSGNAPPMPMTAVGGAGASGLPQQSMAPVAAGSGGPNSFNAGMPSGQWQSIIQALSGLGSNMFGAPQAGNSGYTDPNFLRTLLNGLGGY